MKYLVSKLTTGFILIFITLITVLYSEGWRLNILNPFEQTNPEDIKKETITKTGMIAVRSIPDGAKVFLNDEPVTATGDTITNLEPNKYSLKVSKEGYEVWEKEITVYSDLVTDITAVLVLQSPKLEPLTSLDVNTFALSNNQNNIAFTSSNENQPGLWLLPLNRSGINLFRNESEILIEDETGNLPSQATSISWTIDDKNLILQNENEERTNYEISNDRIISTTNINEEAFLELKEDKMSIWSEEFLSNKIEIIQEQNPPTYIVDSIPESMGNWSPDDEKFFTVRDEKLTVYNSESPLPVGEKRVYETIKNFNDQKTSVYWYSDSYHLIMVEEDESTPNYYTISLIRIDGSNKTAIYSGILASNKAYPNPSGDRIIVLTSLKENTPTNLYSIGLR